MASADHCQTPKNTTRTRPRAVQIEAFAARRPVFGSDAQRSWLRPSAPNAFHQTSEIAPLTTRRMSGPFRRSFAEQPLGAENEDEDEDREDDRLRPVASGRVPHEPLVESLDESDEDRAEDRAGEVPDAAENGGRERDQAELVARVVADLPEVERVHEPARAGERAGDEERERDRPVDVDAHHGGGVAVLRGRAHRLPLSRLLDEPDEDEQPRN